MKKWIFPSIVFLLECIIFLPVMWRGINNFFPSFLVDFYAQLYNATKSFLDLIHFPITIDGKNYFAPSLLLFIFIVNIIIFTIYFVIYAFKTNRIKKDHDAEAIVKRREIDPFDPLFFVNRFPFFRLIFLFVPALLCAFVYLFFLIDNFRLTINSIPFLDKLCHPLSAIYQRYDAAVGIHFASYLWYKIAIFLIIAITIFGFYWIITSFCALVVRYPFARLKAQKAKRNYEKRERQLKKKVLVLENAEILRHANFKMEKAVVETVAKIDSRIGVNPPLYSRDIVSDTPNVIDLGVLIKDQKNENNVLQPTMYRKNIRPVHKKDGTAGNLNLTNYPAEEVMEESKETLQIDNEVKEEITDKTRVMPISHPKLRSKFKKAEVEQVNAEDITLKPYYHNLNVKKNLSPDEAFSQRIVTVKPLVRPVATKSRKSKKNIQGPEIQNEVEIEKIDSSIEDDKILEIEGRHKKKGRKKKNDME